MTRWTTRKPHYFQDLDTAIPRFSTRCGKLVATQYADLVKRNDGRIPSKNGLDLQGLAPAMSNIALAAVSVGKACSFRIVGEALQNRFARKLVGANYYDLIEPAQKDHAIQSVDMVVSVPCAFRACFLQRYDNGIERRAEAGGFPLLSDEPDIDGFVLFVDEETEPARRLTKNLPKMLDAIVLHRDIIDLGFGVDETFQDLVPRGATF